MEKIILNYDPITGCIYDKLEVLVGTCMGIIPFSEQEVQGQEITGSTKTILELKRAGFSVDEIIKIKAYSY